MPDDIEMICDFCRGRFKFPAEGLYQTAPCPFCNKEVFLRYLVVPVPKQETPKPFAKEKELTGVNAELNTIKTRAPFIEQKVLSIGDNYFVFCWLFGILTIILSLLVGATNDHGENIVILVSGIIFGLAIIAQGWILRTLLAGLAEIIILLRDISRTQKEIKAAMGD